MLKGIINSRAVTVNAHSLRNDNDSGETLKFEGRAVIG